MADGLLGKQSSHEPANVDPNDLMKDLMGQRNEGASPPEDKQEKAAATEETSKTESSAEEPTPKAQEEPGKLDSPEKDSSSKEEK